MKTLEKQSNNKLENKSRKMFISIIVLSICVTIGAIYIGVDSYKMKKVVEKDTFYNNIYIEGNDLDGLTKEEAKMFIENKYLQPLYDKKIKFGYDNNNWEISYKEFEGNYNIDEVINEAYNIARSGKLRERYAIIMDLKEHPKKYSLSYTFNNILLENYIKSLEKDINIDMVNSQMQRENSVFTGTPEQVGKKLNVDKTLEMAVEVANKKEDGEIKLVVEELLPQYTKDYYSKMNHIIGSFNTTISNGTEGRINNISLAANSINAKLIYPGEIFSTNKALGDPNAANGYMDAPIILNGKLEDGIGGGVCQVSSTLYNAIMYSELEVVERQCHSRPVGYVEKGRDATIAWDYLDFKFKNSTEYPIYIESSVEKNQVKVQIYGFESRTSGRNFKFESVVTEVLTPPADLIIEDNTLSKGTIIKVSEPKEGYKVKVYKSIYEGDKFIEKVHTSTSTYKPARGEVRVGTKI